MLPLTSWPRRWSILSHGTGELQPPGNARTLGTTLLVGAIHWYQVALSPLLGPACRYYPTCSQYAIEAIQKYGVRRGSWLAVRRLLRCHPFRPGGYDPVP